MYFFQLSKRSSSPPFASPSDATAIVLGSLFIIKIVKINPWSLHTKSVSLTSWGYFSILTNIFVGDFWAVQSTPKLDESTTYRNTLKPNFVKIRKTMKHVFWGSVLNSCHWVFVCVCSYIHIYKIHPVMTWNRLFIYLFIFMSFIMLNEG